MKSKNKEKWVTVCKKIPITKIYCPTEDWTTGIFTRNILNAAVTHTKVKLTRVLEIHQ